VSTAPGQSPQIELSNAQAALALAQNNRVNAVYDYNVARTALSRALGRYSYGSGPGYAQPPTAQETGKPTPVAP
jgi:outer membrane protein TolC